MPHRLGPIAKSAHGKPAKQRARIIAKALADDWRVKQHLTTRAVWTVGPFTVTAADVRAIENDLIVTVLVYDQAGQPVRFENPLIIRNPRLLVPTNETEQAIDSDGNPVTLPICEENPARALEIMVCTEVALQCRP